MGTGETEGEEGRGEEEEEGEEEAEKGKHGKKGEGGRSFLPGGNVSWVFSLWGGRVVFGPTVSGFDEDTKHLWYLADSQLSLA